MDTLLQDLRYGLRSLRHNAAFSLAAVIALALGIGANTAIFSAIDAALLKPLPFPDSARLQSVSFEPRISFNKLHQISRPDVSDLQRDARTFSLAGAVSSGSTLSGDGEALHVPSEGVSANLFEVLGIQPLLGRGFEKGEEGPTGAPAVILSHRLWQSRFGGSGKTLGRSVVLDGKPATVVGILPPRARFPLDGDEPGLYYPLGHGGIDSMLYDNRQGEFLTVVARLNAGATPQQAQVEASALQGQLLAADAKKPRDSLLTLTPLAARLNEAIRPALLLLFGAVGLVLLIACANVANLLLARATSRQRELAVRLAMGATRARIVRQLCTESLLLSLAGGALGLGLAVWGVDALSAAAPASLGRVRDLSLDGTVLGFTLFASVATALLFGLGPALLVSGSPQLHEALQAGARGTRGAHRRLRSALVVAEIALAVALLAGASLLGRTFWVLSRLDPGFRPAGLVLGSLVLPPERYGETQPRLRLARELEQGLSGLSIVKGVATGMPLPMSGGNIILPLEAEGTPLDEREAVRFHAAGLGFFQALGIPLLRGRAFDAAEEEKGGVAILDEAAAKKYFPGVDPLGRRVRFDEKWLTVVGLVGNVRATALDEEAGPQLYVPLPESPWPYLTIAVRGDAGQVSQAMRAELKRIDPGLAFSKLLPYGELLGTSLAERRFGMLALLIFAGLALGLAGVGIYGVMSYTVAQRTQELGIRMALGAQPRDLLGMVLGEGLRLTLFGLAAGGAGAALLVRAIASRVYGVSLTDPRTYAALALAVTGLALLACWLPARRATRVAPAEALRSG